MWRSPHANKLTVHILAAVAEHEWEMDAFEQPPACGMQGTHSGDASAGPIEACDEAAFNRIRAE